MPRLSPASRARSSPTARPCAEQQVVRRGEPGGGLLSPGRVLAADVAEERRAPRLVERRPRVDAVAERVVHVERVLGEASTAVSRFAQPPVSSSACGRSQW